MSQMRSSGCCVLAHEPFGPMPANASSVKCRTLVLLSARKAERSENLQGFVLFAHVHASNQAVVRRSP